MQSTWGPGRYNTLLGVLPAIGLCISLSEFDVLVKSDSTFSWNTHAINVLVVTWFIGIGIGYTGFYCRQVLSATSFTVLGVANKLLTVLWNAMLFDERASPIGIFFLLVCIFGATLYQQAPLRKKEDLPLPMHKAADGVGKGKGDVHDHEDE
jgi:GDP-mannose transporter